MNKVYSRINWKNYPSVDTAVNESNLNRMDYAIDEIDKRVVAHETTKLDKATANSMVKDVEFDETTGIFTITFLNGVTKTLDTKLEKIATNFRYDYLTQKLILTLVDGTTQEIDMSTLITQYEFADSSYIKWTIMSDGKIKAEIIDGSITADKLQPNFLADVTLQANSAKTSEQNAKVSEENAKQSEINAKNYADSAEPVASTANGLNPTLDNSTDAPIIMLQGNGATIQDGTPTPDAPVDIVGVGESGSLEVKTTGNTDEFEEYAETQADIPLSSPLYEGDYIRYNMDGTGEESHKKKAVVFDGSESGWFRNSSSGSFYIDIPDAKMGGAVYCSHYTYNSSSFAEGNITIGSTSAKLFIMATAEQNITSVDEWKAWLAENPITVVYELAESIVTELTAEQIAEFEKLRSFDGTTHVTCEAESKIQYYYDSVGGKAVVSAINKAESVSGVAEQVNSNTEAISIINSTITPEFKSTTPVTVNVANATKTVTAQLPLTKGLWYVNANARWETGSSTGIRTIIVAQTENTGSSQSSNESGMNLIVDTMGGISTNAITQVAKGLVRLTKDATLYLHVIQTSGSAMNVGYNTLSAYKLSDNVV